MAAMGYFAYRCKHKYYRQLLCYDANLSEKGLQLVDTIPRDCIGFKDWVADRITMLENAKIRDIDDTRKVVQPEDGVGADDLGFNVTYDLAWKFADCYIEWTYVIDLDNVAFTVHLRLNNYSYRKGGDLPGVPSEYLSIKWMFGLPLTLAPRSANTNTKLYSRPSFLRPWGAPTWDQLSVSQRFPIEITHYLLQKTSRKLTYAYAPAVQSDIGGFYWNVLCASVSALPIFRRDDFTAMGLPTRTLSCG